MHTGFWPVGSQLDALGASARRALRVFAVLFVGMCLLLAGSAFSQQAVPALKARVTDLTTTLSATQRDTLEARLSDIETRTGTQIAILIVGSTAPEPIEAYSIRVVEQWKLGRKSIDDGVLVLVAKDERRARLEIGYGLEGAIPDAIARRMIDQHMAPRFRQGDFVGGLSATVDAIEARIAGEALPAPGARGLDATGPDWLPALLFMAFAGLVLTRVFGVFPGSMLGGAGAGFLAVQAGASLLVAVAGGLVLFFVLLLFGAASRLGRVGRHTYRSQPPVIFPGGRSRGGGFGGGGFGGGGGGFGGGGASGGW